MTASTSATTGRLKRPGWTDPRLLVGVVLIALSLVITSSVVANADRTEPYLAARDTLTPGTVVHEGDLVVVHVRVGHGTYATPEASPVGMVVTRTIGAGELIPESALVDPAAFSTRPVAVMTSTPLADGIDKGALVDVWLTRDGLVGPESVLVAGGLVVDQVDRDSGTFSGGAAGTVYVIVPGDQVGDFLASLAGATDVAVVGVAGSAAS